MPIFFFFFLGGGCLPTFFLLFSVGYVWVGGGGVTVGRVWWGAGGITQIGLLSLN